MQERTVNNAIGVMTYWRPADCDRTELRRLLADVGLDRFLPSTRRPNALLRETIQEWVTNNWASQSGSKFLVRPLKDNEGVTVVEEVQGQMDNAYVTRFTAKVEDPDRYKVVTAPCQSFEWDLRDIYRRLHEVVTGPQVTHLLVDIIDSLGGLTLRENGGLYWLHGDQLANWAAAAKAVESATLAGQVATVYVLKQLMDEEGVRAVHDAAVREVTTECARINEEIMSGDLGKRALEERQRQVDHLRNKIGALDSILGGSMARLKATLDEAETAASAAVLMLAAEAGRASANAA